MLQVLKIAFIDIRGNNSYGTLVKRSRELSDEKNYCLIITSLSTSYKSLTELTDVCIYIYIYIFIYIYVCIYVYIYICIYIREH